MHPLLSPIFTGFLEVNSQRRSGIFVSEDVGNLLTLVIYIADSLSQNVIHISAPTAMGGRLVSL